MAEAFCKERVTGNHDKTADQANAVIIGDSRNVDEKTEAVQ